MSFGMMPSQQACLFVVAFSPSVFSRHCHSDMVTLVRALRKYAGANANKYVRICDSITQSLMWIELYIEGIWCLEHKIFVLNTKFRAEAQSL